MATSAISGCRKHQCKSGALQQQCSGAAKSSAVRGSTEYLYKHQRAYRYRSPRSKCWEQGKCISVTVGSCSSAAIARDREDGQWRVEPEALSGGIAKAASKKRPKLRTGGSTLQRDAERHSGQGIGLGLNPSSRMGIRQWVRAALVQVRVLAGRLGHGLGGGGEGIQQRLFSLCLCGDLFFFFLEKAKKDGTATEGPSFVHIPWQYRAGRYPMAQRNQEASGCAKQTRSRVRRERQWTSMLRIDEAMREDE